MNGWFENNPYIEPFLAMAVSSLGNLMVQRWSAWAGAPRTVVAISGASALASAAATLYLAFKMWRRFF